MLGIWSFPLKGSVYQATEKAFAAITRSAGVTNWGNCSPGTIALSDADDHDLWRVRQISASANAFPGPSSAHTSKGQSELDKQRQESVATALQLYANPQEAGIKLLLPPLMDKAPRAL